MKNAEGRMWKAEKRTLCRVQQTLMLRIPPSQSPLPPSPFALPPSQSPLGLTLIELLVVIAILTTLVAGVVPVLSPNNDTRKIREAARGLQSYIMLAQANAQRTGRPAGISFTESAAGTGVALDVQPIETPPAFSGFSEYSRVIVRPTNSSTDPDVIYGADSGGLNGNGGTRFSGQYEGYPLYELRFFLADGSYTNDPFPPRMFRIGDQVSVEGNLFLLVDDDDFTSSPNLVAGYPASLPADERTYFLEPPDPAATPALTIQAIWINNSGQLTPEGFKRYKIHRQPIGQNTKPFASAGASFQLPRGVAIDLQASGVEGNTIIPNTFPVNSFDSTTIDSTIGIMFSPNGSVSQVFFNGNEVQNVARLFLCLGRVENGAPADFDFSTFGSNATEQVEEKRKEINWLALDSRWLTISTQSGNTTVSENAFVDARQPAFVGGSDEETAALQISAARDFAREQKRGGGN